MAFIRFITSIEDQDFIDQLVIPECVEETSTTGPPTPHSAKPASSPKVSQYVVLMDDIVVHPSREGAGGTQNRDAFREKDATAA